jgi:transcription antitermination factor NusG
VQDGKPALEFAGQPGWTVKLGPDAGAYFGFLGEIERIAPGQELSILIASFGRSVRMTVRQDQVDELISPQGETVVNVQTS